MIYDHSYFGVSVILNRKILFFVAYFPHQPMLSSAYILLIQKLFQNQQLKFTYLINGDWNAEMRKYSQKSCRSKKTIHFVRFHNFIHIIKILMEIIAFKYFGHSLSLNSVKFNESKKQLNAHMLYKIVYCIYLVIIILNFIYLFFNLLISFILIKKIYVRKFPYLYLQITHLHILYCGSVYIYLLLQSSNVMYVHKM